MTLSALALTMSSCRSHSSNQSGGATAGNNLPQLSMEKMKIQSFGPDGLEWVLVTPTALGYSTQNKMHAQDLLITFYRNGRKATDLTADEGVIRFEDNRPSASTSTSIKYQDGPVGLGPGDLYLTGNVVAVSTDGSKLLTDWLLYDKSTGIVTSSAPVRVLREDSITNGVGLEATADLSHVKIFNQTVTIKEKPRKKHG